MPSLRDRIEVVPPGADIAAIQAAEPLPKLLTTIVTLGPLSEASASTASSRRSRISGPGYQLIVIGRGPERRSLAAHAANLGVTQQVGFVGPVEDETLFRWLRTADVVVNMSDESMSGGSLLEAACAGSPIVASDIAAHLEVAGRLDATAVHIVSSQSSPLMLADEIRLALRGSGSTGSTLPSCPGQTQQTRRSGTIATCSPRWRRSRDTCGWPLSRPPRTEALHNEHDPGLQAGVVGVFERGGGDAVAR